MYIKGLSCSLYGWVSTAAFGTWEGVRRGVGATVNLGYGATRAGLGGRSPLAGAGPVPGAGIPPPGGGGAGGTGGNARAQAGGPTQTQINNAYATLRVSNTASWNEIRKAYRREIRINHPDQFVSDNSDRIAEATRRTQDINIAYSTLRRVFGL